MEETGLSSFPRGDTEKVKTGRQSGRERLTLEYNLRLECVERMKASYCSDGFLTWAFCCIFLYC